MNWTAACLLLLCMTSCSLLEMPHTEISLEKTDVPPEEEKFCDTNPWCCGIYSEAESYLKGISKRALEESNVELCYEIPDDEPLAVCPGTLSWFVYSRDLCIYEAAIKTGDISLCDEIKRENRSMMPGEEGGFIRHNKEDCVADIGS